jgi:SCY1-like protein 2
MVEPLEETRSELIFATEPILSSLELSIPGYGRHASVVELDEVEVCPCALERGCFLLNSALLH